MKTKFLLPVLAIIFAVGMSFTTVNASLDTEAWIDLGDGTPFEINTIPCEGTGNDCQVIVQSLANPGPYTLYKDIELQDPYDANTPTPYTITD
ncbi:hypothetical protein KO529_01670 [Arenibacter algicola]|uniref:DUF6520 family protein n=1 Tax=Arenibacter algicola TaxID=616991 RepID=UPI001C07A5E7|nr:DUF6520 family protein [Arenibacter algicola]MBU2903478.1 hypothetical protein [Arenibacter algicola]